MRIQSIPISYIFKRKRKIKPSQKTKDIKKDPQK